MTDYQPPRFDASLLRMPILNNALAGRCIITAFLSMIFVQACLSPAMALEPAGPQMQDSPASAAPSGLNIPVIEPPTVMPTESFRPPALDSIKPGTPGTVAGHIGDSEGKRNIDHAQVVLIKSDKDHEHIEQESDGSGKFTFTGVEPGDYTVTVSAKGMLSHTSRLKLASGEIKSIEINLDDLEPVDILRVTGKRTLNPSRKNWQQHQS